MKVHVPEHKWDLFFKELHNFWGVRMSFEDKDVENLLGPSQHVAPHIMIIVL